MYLLNATAQALPQALEPVGPSGWTLRNWIGALLQISIFVVVVLVLYHIASRQQVSQGVSPLTK